MATWSIAGGVVHLELDGSETGPVLRERTFNFPGKPDTLHTFYLKVTQSHVGLRACLQVVGGDSVEATVADAQERLVAGGNTDGSANITVRFGVLAPAGGGGGAGSGGDTLQHADTAAAAAAGWANTGGVAAVWNSGQPVGGFPTSVKVTAPSTGEVRRTLNFPPGAGVIFQVTTTAGSGPWWPACGVNIYGSDGTQHGGMGAHGGDVDVTRSTPVITVPPDGILIVGIRSEDLFGTREHFYAGLEWAVIGASAQEADFEDLEYCEGSGEGDGNSGNGGDPDTPGNEPPPTPPPGGWPDPITGPPERAFGIFNISAAGYAYWNLTVKSITPRNVRALLNQASTAGTWLLVRFGPEEAWLLNGSWSRAAWDDLFDGFVADAGAVAALEAAILTGKVWCYVVDEPFHKTRWGRAPIPWADVEYMCMRIKDRFPLWRTVVRVDPTDARMPRNFSGNDTLCGEYSLARGPVLTYRRTRIEAALDMGVDLIMGPHYKHFEGPAGPDPRYITPAELEHYGGALVTPDPAFPDFRILASLGWRWDPGLVAQATFMDKLRGVRDLHASFDP